MTNKKTILGITFAFVFGIASVATAKPMTSGAPVAPLPKAATLVADNVVVTPQGQSAPAAAPAQPTQVNVQPQNTQSEPVVDQGPRKSVHTEVAPQRNYVSTIAVSALMGAVAGALIGGAIYYLDDEPRGNARNIGYWAAGGVLVGTGIGVTQVFVQESRASEAVSMKQLPKDPAPTVRVALLRAEF